MNRQAALDRYVKEQREVAEKEKIKDEARKKMSERVHNYSRYVKEMYFPKVSKEKNDEIEDIISKLKINLSNESLAKGSPDGLRKSSSMIKLREVKSQLATPMRSSKNHSALKSLDKYAHAVKSILEREENEGEEERAINHINWKAKHNPMIREKYVPPQPTQFHDSTVQYLDDLRHKRKADGINP
jgi:hypothetical protein